MADDFKLHKDAERGARAQELVESVTLQAAFDDLETAYIDFWRSSVALNDIQGRERLWQAVQIVGKVREHLKITAANGRVALAELQNLAQGGK